MHTTLFSQYSMFRIGPLYFAYDITFTFFICDRNHIVHIELGLDMQVIPPEIRKLYFTGFLRTVSGKSKHLLYSIHTR